MDKTWLHSFDPECKNAKYGLETCLLSTLTLPRKFRVVASACRVMATVFWDAEGIVLIDYIEHDSIVTGIYYAGLIRKARAALKEKRREKLLFHQDNAPA